MASCISAAKRKFVVMKGKKNIHLLYTRELNSAESSNLSWGTRMNSRYAAELLLGEGERWEEASKN